MKLYPLLSHNIEIVKFLGPIKTNPMKQNEQKKSLNTNQRHSTVQCNAMQCICYDTNNCHITHRFIQKSTLRNEWNEELLIFQQKKVFLYYGKLFLYRSLWFVLLQVSKVWHWFFFIWMKCIQFSMIILCMRKKMRSNGFQKKIFFHSKSW